MPGVRAVGQDLSGSTVNKKCPECSRIKVMKFEYNNVNKMHFKNG